LQLLVDANVLIDYLEGDLLVLQSVTRHLGRVYVPSVVLDEVQRVDERICDQLGIEVVEPSLDQILQAAAGGGRLSFEDRVCCLMARELGWTCVTNDSSLRRECLSQGVKVLWGLQLMVRLVAAGHLVPEEALAIAQRIQRSNPRHITEDILNRFRATVGLA
jgi:predicted nucleic acid-binding protein